DKVAKKPPKDAPIAKVEKKRRILIPVETTKRTAAKTTAPRTSTSNTTRYMDSGNQRRTLSPTTQRIVAAEKRTDPSPAAKTERKSFWTKFKERIKSGSSSRSSRSRPIGRRRGLFGRR
ncbi:MAG: hypothetical protein ACR2RV_16180, partial [Verrucomicrobiales bacterium]